MEGLFYIKEFPGLPLGLPLGLPWGADPKNKVKLWRLGCGYGRSGRFGRLVSVEKWKEEPCGPGGEEGTER